VSTPENASRLLKALVAPFISPILPHRNNRQHQLAKFTGKSLALLNSADAALHEGNLYALN
jgi:hypothetical protein